MATNCKRCGTPLLPDETNALCAPCLLEGGRAVPARPAPFEAPTVAELAARFPHLEVIELVGQGGMGAVYRARQPKLDRFVALKVLRPEAAGEVAFTDRFLREARVLARLSHPGIVGVHDFGVDGDLHWLLMEYVDGASLREVLEAGTLPPEDALGLVPQLCEALQYAHDHGVVHRDIKPENILLDAAGRVRIADFGLALLDDREAGLSRLTGTHEVFGTPRYMAPEQLEGAKKVDHRADIYALGAVLYEALTGELPLGRFDPPSERDPGLDRRVDDVVMRTLEKQPDRRYQRASEVRDAVVGLGSDAPAGAAAPALEPGETPPHEGLLWACACLAALGVGMAGIFVSDAPWPVIATWLPGCGFGAIMAQRKATTGDQVFALFLLLGSLAVILVAMLEHESAGGLWGAVAFGTGLGMGYSEEKKRWEPAA